MNSKPNGGGSRTGRGTRGGRATRRAFLAAGGAVALAGLAGCSAVDGLIDSASEQVVGTTASAPAAFYPGRAPTAALARGASSPGRSDGPHLFHSGRSEVRHVPATLRVESREIDLEGWSTSGATKAQDYNATRSNKPTSEWWGGPDDDSDGDGYGDTLVAIQDVELELLGHVLTASEAVDRRDRAAANAALDAFVDATTGALTPALDRCETGVCGTIREHSGARMQGVRRARDAVDGGDWDAAASELAAVEQVNLGDIERLDDELADRRPGRPRFSDLVAYLRDEPTIGEQFTVCLPDAELPGDGGSLAEELTLDRVLAYFAASNEPDGRRPPFHDRYGTHGIQYDEEGCLRLDGPVSLHEDLACQNILSADLDTYTTANRGIVGYATEGGAVVSAAPTTVDTVGKRVFLAADVTGEIILGEDRDMVMPGDNVSSSGSQTLVCPVTVTPADCPCPLPGLFYVRRSTHDEQVVFAGGWVLDEGALYEDSATLLFAEGPTEFASVTPADTESDDYDARIVEQFSRDRSQFGSAVVVLDPDDDGDGIPTALRSDEGRKGLNAVNVKVLGEQSDDAGDADSDGDGIDDGGDEGGDDDLAPGHTSVTALDAPLVHLAGAGSLSTEKKRTTNLVPAVNNISSR